MGENSGIQWTTHTFNPWEGCEKVSPGCKFCYAEARDKRFTGGKHWGPAGARRRTSVSNWNQPVRWNRLAGKEQRRERVFCASLADVFEDRPELRPWRDDLFRLIRSTPWLDWQLLTKRPENIERLLLGSLDRIDRNEHGLTKTMLDQWLGGTPPANVWLGCTVENQEQVDLRIPHLLKVPATVRFLSAEPLLEHIDLTRALDGFNGVDWVIVGGESGGGEDGPRPFFIEWAQDIVKQCRAAGVAPFVKQLGGNPAEYVGLDSEEIDLKDPHGGDWDEWPCPKLRVREFPDSIREA